MATLLEQVEKAAQRVTEAEQNLAREREALHTLLRSAHSEGIPIARIARAAGLSRQRVHTLIQR
jgi:hypothetical protein